MNDDLRKALDGAIAGDAALLQGFGLERRTTVGNVFPPDTFEWEERMTVRGDGAARLLVRRSVADVSGEEVGEYRHELDRNELFALMSQVRAARWEDFVPAHLEPTDLKVRISVVAGGRTGEVFVGAGDPNALAPLQDVLNALDQLAMNLRRKPFMTLVLRIALPRQVRRSDPLEVTLGLRNTGTVGFWVRDPARCGASLGHDRCALLYCQAPSAPPGVTPLPAIATETPLLAAAIDPRELIWLDPGNEVECRLTASPKFAGTGAHIVRASFATYGGEDTVSGQPRLRGCAFSNEVEVQVS